MPVLKNLAMAALALEAALPLQVGCEEAERHIYGEHAFKRLLADWRASKHGKGRRAEPQHVAHRCRQDPKLLDTSGSMRSRID